MRILVIDDQARTGRADKFNAALVGHDITYLTTFPVSWDTFRGYEVISWDNDLGDDGDVITRLRTLCWEDPDLFKGLFSSKIHLVHSANPIATERMVSLFQAARAKVRRIHIKDYTHDEVNRSLTL